jgi:hypothetical protein
MGWEGDHVWQEDKDLKTGDHDLFEGVILVFAREN